MKRFSARLAAVLAAVTLMVAAAPAASATTVSGRGTVTANRYLGGAPAKGGVRISAGLQVQSDATGAIVGVRGAASITKLSRVAVVQVDGVVLSTATRALISKTTPVSSGTKISAVSDTAWRAVATGSCTNYRVQVNYRVKWAGGAVGTFTVLSPLTKVCRSIIVRIRYANCTALRKVYPHGVGRPGAKDRTASVPVTNFTVDPATYLLNKVSDQDKDGIACEMH